MYDCFATPKGLEVRLFRRLLIYRLRKENIVNAHVIEGMFKFAALIKRGSYPWNTISMGNRICRRWILLEKRQWPRFLAITPDDPERFIQALGLRSNAGPPS